MAPLPTPCSLPPTPRAQGDLLLLAAGAEARVNASLDRVRQYLAASLGEVPRQGTAAHSLHWVVDFPMFEWSEEQGRLQALHHPFTAPNQEDLQASA